MYLHDDEGLGDGWSRPCPPDVMTEQEGKDAALLFKLMSNRSCGPANLRSSTINCLTDRVFYVKHPEMVRDDGTRIPLPAFRDATREQKLLIYEWRDIRNCFVIPALKVFLRAEKKEK